MKIELSNSVEYNFVGREKHRLHGGIFKNPTFYKEFL